MKQTMLIEEDGSKTLPRNGKSLDRASNRKIKRVLKGLGLLFILCFGVIYVYDWFSGSQPYSVRWETKRDAGQIHAAIEGHVHSAERKAVEVIDRRVEKFSNFIESRKIGAAPFSQEVVSYYGKWRVLRARLPFTDKDSHRQWIEERFNHHIFSHEQLAGAVKLAIEGSVKDIEAIENDLAVAIQQELLGRSLSPSEFPIATKQFHQAIEQMLSASRIDAAKTAANLGVSEVASAVGTSVLVRLGISAGIWSAGARYSIWTMGASLLIGLIVDLVWEAIDNPAGDIEQSLMEALDQLSSDAGAAISDEMAKIVSQRSQLWTRTAKELAS